MKSNLFLTFIFLTQIVCCMSEPFAITGGITVIGAVGAALYTNFNNIFCSFYECCQRPSQETNRWIRNNATDLRNRLNSQVYGQHLAVRSVVAAIQAHLTDVSPRKALVLSFHGWFGSGKNYVAKIIAESIYKRGMESKYVHLFPSTVIFPHEEKADIYKMQIQDWIRGNVSLCEHSLFIFDEIDKMPEGMIDGIKAFIDYHEEVFEINFRKNIFIFLSNTGSREINQKIIQFWREGKARENIKYSDIEELILKGAFNEEGGLHQSELIQHSLVDYYIPFLPLEKKYVKRCIVDELKRQKFERTEEIVEEIADTLIYFPPGSKVFSSTGCKRVSQKVGYYIAEKFYNMLL